MSEQRACCVKFQKLMTKDAKTLAENLINIILKIYLFDKIEEKDLKNLLGVEKFNYGEIEEENGVGVVTGLTTKFI